MAPELMETVYQAMFGAPAATPTTKIGYKIGVRAFLEGFSEDFVILIATFIYYSLKRMVQGKESVQTGVQEGKTCKPWIIEGRS